MMVTMTGMAGEVMVVVAAATAATEVTESREEEAAATNRAATDGRRSIAFCVATAIDNMTP